MAKPILQTFQTVAPMFIQKYERYLPTAFDESMTLLEKMNKIIVYLNQIGELTNNVVEQWNKVMEWVSNDGITEQLMSRLDQMVTDGTFATIINEELLNSKPDIYVTPEEPTQKTTNTYWFKKSNESVEMKKFNGEEFDSLYPLTKAENVVNEKGDTLEKAVSQSTNIEGIKKETLYDEATKTSYHLVTIPYYDKNGNVNKIQRGFANDKPNSGQRETARSFSKRHNASLAVNASIYGLEDFKLQGMHIQNGVEINSLPTRVDRHILGITEDGILKTYTSTTPASVIIGDGCGTALTSFLPLIVNGAQVSQSILDSYEATDWAYRRQVIAQMPNKDYVILSGEGDTLGNVGLNLYDCIRILMYKGVAFAFMLDGGGSMQTVVRGTNICSFKDDDGMTERGVVDFLYWNKELLTDKDKAVIETSSDVGDVNHKVTKLEKEVYDKTEMNKGFIQLKGNEDYTTHGIEIWKGDQKQYKLSLSEEAFGFFDYNAGKYLFQVGLTSGDIITNSGAIGNVNQYAVVAEDLNYLGKSGWVWATNSTLNSPDQAFSWAIQTIRLNTQSALQIAHCFTSPHETKKRRLNNGTWEAWV